MKKLISLLTVLTLLLGALAVIPVSAGDTDTLDDHLITHYDFAGDNVLADKAANGSSTDNLTAFTNDGKVDLSTNGYVTLNQNGRRFLYAADSDDFFKTTESRTLFIRFNISGYQNNARSYYPMATQNGALNVFTDTPKKTDGVVVGTSIRAATTILGANSSSDKIVENAVFSTNTDPTGVGTNQWFEIAISYDKTYDQDGNLTLMSTLYTQKSDGTWKVRKTCDSSLSSSIVCTDTGSHTHNNNVDFERDECLYNGTTCSANSSGCRSKLIGTADAFILGANLHMCDLGNNSTLILDDVRIYDKALNLTEVSSISATITNPEPTPGVVPPPAGDDSDTEQFTNVGHSLTLDGNTDINYYFKPVDGAQISDNAEVKLTAGGKQVDVKTLSEVAKTDGTYKYSYGIPAKQMNDVFTLTVTDGGATVYTNTYSVRQYVDTILAGNYSTELKALVKAMANYGAYSQLAFNYDTDNLANAGLNLAAPADITVTEGLGADTEGSASGISYSAATLVLNDVTHVVFKFIVSGVALEDITVTGADDYKLIAGTTLQVKSEGLVADKLDNEVTVAVTVGGETLTVSYSPLAYIMNMANAEDANTQNLVKAMYAYHVAAQAYTATLA